MTDIDFDELDKAVNSLMSKQRAAENKTDIGEGAAPDASLASGNENSPELVVPTISSTENASPDSTNNNAGGNIPVSVSHSSPVMQTSSISQTAETPVAKIGTEAPKLSPNTEAEANAVKVTTVPSVPEDTRPQCDHCHHCQNGWACPGPAGYLGCLAPY